MSKGGELTGEPDGLRALRRLAAIVSGSQDAILAKDLDGVITDWNPAAERLFGHTAEEAIGRPVWNIIIPPDRAEEERVLLRRALADEPVQGVLTERLRRDGSRGAGVAHDGADPRRGRPGHRRLDDGARRHGVAARGRGAHAPRGDRPVDERRRRRHGPRGPDHRLQHGGRRDVRADPGLDRCVGPRRGRRRRVRARPARRHRPPCGCGRDARLRGPATRRRGPRLRPREHDRPDPRRRRSRSPGSRRSRATSPSSARRRSSSAGSRRSSTPRATRSSASRLDGTIVSWNPAAARMFGWTDEEAIGRPAGDMFVKEGRHRRHAELMRGIAAGDAFEDEAEGGRRREAHDVRGDGHRLPGPRRARTVHAAAFIVRDVTEQRAARGAARAGPADGGGRAASPAASPTTSTTS